MITPKRTDQPVPRDGGTPAALIEVFQSEKLRLHQVAYALTGSVVVADHCVRGAWSCLRQVEHAETLGDPRAWLTAMVARCALDAARTAHERAGATRMPPRLDEFDRAERDALAESLGVALSVVLERLARTERAASALHEFLQRSSASHTSSHDEPS
jgi:DNA-directed RNA polymerase specialized sigma24 family protein